MRRNLLLVLSMLMLAAYPVQASITVEETTEPEYLINYGYSEAMAEEVSVVKNRVNGQSVEPLYEKQHNKFVRFWRNLYSYLDPASDNDERLHHDIHMSPSYRDL